MIKAHDESIVNILQLHDGRLISASIDRTIKMWTLDGNSSTFYKSGQRYVNNIIQLHNGNIAFSLHLQEKIIIMTLEGRILHNVKVHRDEISHITQLKDERIVTCSSKIVRIQPSEDYGMIILKGHTDVINGVIELYDGRILSYDKDGIIKFWDNSNGRCRYTMDIGHIINHVIQLNDTRLFCQGSYDAGIIISLDGSFKKVIDFSIFRAIQLRDGRMLSVSITGILKIWSPDNDVVHILGETDTNINCMIQLQDDRIVTGYHDGIMRFWSLPVVIKIDQCKLYDVYFH